MKRRLAIMCAGTALAIAISACASAAADDPNNTSEKIADNGSYVTYLDRHAIDGRTVTCLVVRTSTTSMSCDWTAK